MQMDISVVELAGGLFSTEKLLNIHTYMYKYVYYTNQERCGCL